MIITPVLILLMIVVFIPTFLFVKTIDDRKWLTLVISIVITPVIYFYAFYPMLNIFSSYHHQKYFNSLAWKDAPELRYEMLNDITSSKKFIGMSKEEILKNLGKYEWLGWDFKNNKADEDFWNYSIGIKPGAFNEYKEILEIYFNDNIVTRVSSSSEKITYNE